VLITGLKVLFSYFRPMSILPVLNIKQFDNDELKGDFYANTFAKHLSTHHASITKPHKHNFYLAVLFLQGTGTHEIDFKSYPIQPGSLFFMRPGQTHHWELSPNVDGYIFFHSKEFYNLIFQNRNVDDYPLFDPHHGSPHVQLGSKELNVYFKHFRDIYEEYKSDQWMTYRRFALLVDFLYLDFSRKIISEGSEAKDWSSKGMEWLHKLQKLVDTHYLKEKQPGFYADQLNISVKHLNKMMVKSIGKSTRDLIHERIILEAKRMLTHSDSSIQEISLELGYDDASYFSRFFKKKTGVKPTEFSQKYTGALI